ncbi:MAG: TIGR02453 family protein [Flavobacteriaceae bacterium]|nr:MAG: TIGR02453 family protein [Flavobacteriaceae bacterium]
MDKPVITKNSLEFLNKLKENNTREWFAEHKVEYKKHEVQVKGFYNSLMDRLNVHDEIEKQKMFRIYRDVRFSKDKTPYNSHFSGSFSRSGNKLRGGYFLKIKNNESFMATGFWEPNKEDLFRIRKEFELDTTEIRQIINNKSFKNIWGELVGDEVKFAPKGFNKEDPNIDLIKRKQYIFVKNFTNKEVLSSNFIEVVDDSFKAIRPYFNLMSDILTTNLNGESLFN